VRCLICSLALVLLALPSHAAHLEIYRETSWMSVVASDGSGSHAENQFTPRVPFQDAHSATDYASAAAATYDFSSRGFDIHFDLASDSGANSYGESSGRIVFTVDADMRYVASGTYFAADTNGRNGDLSVSLWDGNDLGYLFNSEQISLATVNESFVLGGNGGDAFNLSEGSLTGLLRANHEYLLEYTAWIRRGSGAITPFNDATGFINLELVPEPSSSVLVAAGLLALVVSRTVCRRWMAPS
jgi:hypothetical protein